MMPVQMMATAATSAAAANKVRVVIVGGGFGSVILAPHLDCMEGVHLSLIDTKEYFGAWVRVGARGCVRCVRGCVRGSARG